jgi:hypothetical protein
MSRRIQTRLERLEELGGSSDQRHDPETRARVREWLGRIEQARRDGSLTEEDRAEIRARANAERSQGEEFELDNRSRGKGARRHEHQK